MTSARSCHGQGTATGSWPLEAVRRGAPPPAPRGRRARWGMALPPMSRRAVTRRLSHNFLDLFESLVGHQHDFAPPVSSTAGTFGQDTGRFVLAVFLAPAPPSIEVRLIRGPTKLACIVCLMKTQRATPKGTTWVGEAQ